MNKEQIVLDLSLELLKENMRRSASEISPEDAIRTYFQYAEKMADTFEDAVRGFRRACGANWIG